MNAVAVPTASVVYEQARDFYVGVIQEKHVGLLEDRIRTDPHGEYFPPGVVTDPYNARRANQEQAMLVGTILRDLHVEDTTERDAIMVGTLVDRPDLAQIFRVLYLPFEQDNEDAVRAYLQRQWALDPAMIQELYTTEVEAGQRSAQEFMVVNYAHDFLQTYRRVTGENLLRTLGRELVAHKKKCAHSSV